MATLVGWVVEFDVAIATPRCVVWLVPAGCLRSQWGRYTTWLVFLALVPLVPSSLESIQPARTLLGLTGLATANPPNEGRE